MRKKKIDRVSIMNSNTMAKRRLEYAKKLISDPEKDQRLKDQLCVSCKYTARVGGSMVTHSECAICSKDMVFSSTAVDFLCQECAKKNYLCKCCGADIALRDRRKPRDYEL